MKKSKRVKLNYMHQKKNKEKINNMRTQRQPLYCSVKSCYIHSASTLLVTPVLLLIAVIQIIESAFRCISKHLTEKSINTVSKYL